MAGIYSNAWAKCESKTARSGSSSYRNCPTRDLKRGKSLAVTVHNPSNVEILEVELPVAPGTYSANAYNETTEKFEPVASPVQCFDDYEWTDKTTNFTSCYLAIKSSVPSLGYAFIKVKMENETFPKPAKLKLNDSITRNYTGYKESESILELIYSGTEDDRLRFEFAVGSSY